MPTYKEAAHAAFAEFQSSYLEALLEEHNGNVSKAAHAAGMNRSYLHRLMREHGIKGAGAGWRRRVHATG